MFIDLKQGLETIVTSDLYWTTETNWEANHLELENNFDWNWTKTKNIISDHEQTNK
jgi:hypothetical protein